MLRVKDICQKLILAPEVMVERPLRELRRGGDVIHRDASVPLLPELLVGRVEDPRASLL
jgi:hypothetical protein